MTRKKPSRTINMYKSYSFTTKDLIIDEIRTAFQDIGNLKAVIKEAHENSGVAIHTMDEWFFGKTRCPRSATIEAALRGVGLYRPIRRMPTEMKEKLGLVFPRRKTGE